MLKDVTVRRSNLELQPRDRAILMTLTRRVRVLTLAQIGRVWWSQTKHPERNAAGRSAALEQGGLLRLCTLMAHPEIPLRRPLGSWQPGLLPPDLKKLAKGLAARWTESDTATRCVVATEEAGVRFAGHGGRPPRDSEATHDIHLAAVYLKMAEELPTRAQSWVPEAELPKGQGVKVPDAIVKDGLYQTAVEFGGRYPEPKLRAFHDYCAERDLGYEVW
jgi:hypothetical protein